MMRKPLANLWYQAWSLVLAEMSPQEISWLLRARDHISLLEARRTTMIVSRVRLVAGLFAVLTPMWIIIDVLAFPPRVWIDLVIARVAATGAFLALLLAARRTYGMTDAYRALGMLLAIPTAFFIFSYQHMARFEMHGIQEAFATGYAFLPFVMLAGLSVFPLTLLESLGFAAPMLAMEIVAAAMRLPFLDWPPLAASFWLLLLIAAVAALAGVSQLALMIVLVREAIRDGLTGCFSRQSAEELLALQFTIAARANAPMALAFLDLDHFKSINDRYGHDAGDGVLINAVAEIRDNLRVGDMLARWGGEEFLIIMPNTTGRRACTALERLQAAGLGRRPDGTPLTASIGVAERQADAAQAWQRLVELADGRMYEAKNAGRNRLVGCRNAATPA
jgi:diguanylate cyclase (GGDEF)-like protein